LLLAKKFFTQPCAVPQDWELAIVGQRVQSIKPDPKQAKEIQFRKNLKKAAPSYRMNLTKDLQLLKQIRARVDGVLGLGTSRARELKDVGAA
jgi:L-2-hydroxyglutarate oxidase LhgO